MSKPVYAKECRPLSNYFRKLVHGKGCKKLSECPRWHKKSCDQNLSLITSIWWTIANIIDRIPSIGSLEEARKFIDKFDMIIIYIVGNHKNSYPEEYDKMYKVINLLYRVHSYFKSKE